MAKEIKNLSVEQLQDIENIIGYTFTNKALLEQAFTRSSFVNENKDAVSNEVLEFYGDRALDLAVTIALSKTYGDIENGQYVTKMGDGYAPVINEGFLSSIKQSLVNKNNLSRRIQELGLSKYLRVGNNDEKADVRFTKSVQEDLFESICGAMAIETNWNFEIIYNVILNMLDYPTLYKEATGTESDKAAYFYSWYFKHYGQLPAFKIDTFDFLISDKEDVTVSFKMENDNGYSLYHEVRADNAEKARNLLAVWFYEQLFLEDEVYNFFPDEHKSLFKEKWLNVSLENSINVLQEMEQAKLVKNVKYDFKQEGNDDNGNPLWYGCLSLDINSQYDENISSELGRGGFQNKTDCKKCLALGGIYTVFNRFNINYRNN